MRLLLALRSFVFAFFTQVGAAVSVKQLASDFGWTEFTNQLAKITPATGITILICTSIVWALRQTARKTVASCTVPKRETVIEVEIKELFRRRAAYVVPVTTCIDCDMDAGIIQSDSVLGALIRRFFKGDWKVLKTKVQNALAQRPDIASDGVGERGEPSYPIGTVLRVDHSVSFLWWHRKVIVFLVCSSRVIHGQGKCEVDEVLSAAASLFSFLKERGGYIGPVRMPVLGTGYGRLEYGVGEVARELALLFLASCTDRRYIEKMTIAVYPPQDRKFPVDMVMMQAFLLEHCSFQRIPMQAHSDEERPTGQVVE